MKSLIVFASVILLMACQQNEHAQHSAAPAPAPAQQQPAASAQTSDGVQTVDLKISGGEYQPATISVREGIPVRLNVTRDEKPGCGEVLVIPAHNVNKPIPVNQVTTIEFTPAKAGELEFTCGMNMMKGKIVVQGAGA